MRYSHTLQMDPGYTAPPSERSSQGGGRGRGRGHSSDESLVTVTGIFPKETVGVVLLGALVMPLIMYNLMLYGNYCMTSVDIFIDAAA
jgi:hypothetical protein